jgi:Ca-activated chloride channel family protein
MSRRSQRRSASSSTASVRPVLLVLIAGLFLLVGSCCGIYALLNRVINGGGDIVAPPDEPGLTVAYSPEKALVFGALVDGFNGQDLKTVDGETMRVRTVELDPESMINTVLEGSATFQALTPDSSVWLGQLDQEWSELVGQDTLAVGETVRYAVSPVVIATWEDLARGLGWPERAVSWLDLLNEAQANPDFRWSHPSTSSASGLLTTLAEFYAGAGKSRGLTNEDVTNQQTLDYVAALEKTIRYYGEGNEPAIIQQALAEGRDFLDAFVVQEQMVIYYNTHRQGGERLVALYPAEGAMWEDHPLALLETAEPTPYQRQVFARFRDYLLSTEAQQLILRHGYRPADLSIALDGVESPLTADNGANPAEPKTTLQVPSASVVKVVRDVWWYTKRHTNVYLVVDTSGSMRGEKLEQAQVALRAFLEQIEGDMERVGLIQFHTDVQMVVYLDELGHNRTALETAVDGLQAAGDTALLDGVDVALRRLQELGDAERINAIVVMTDGRENASSTSLQRLVRNLEQDSPVPVVVFCIAYGSDADMEILRAIAEPTGGQVREGDLETIRDLYKLLSTYF